MSLEDLATLGDALAEFAIASGTATVGARIYDSSSGSLLASADAGVGSGADQSVTLPISVSLLAGQTYRVAFFIDAGGTEGAGDGFDATPAGIDLLDYLDATGSLLVSQAYSLSSDAFPTLSNSFVPFIKLEAAIPEPSLPLLLVLAASSLGLLRR